MVRIRLIKEPLLVTLSWQRSLSYSNQSIDLQSKSMNWFLYDRGKSPMVIWWSKSFLKWSIFVKTFRKNHCSVRETDRLISQAICFFSNLSQKKLLKQSTLIKLIFGRGILAPLFYEHPSVVYLPFFKSCPTTLSSSLSPPTPSPTALSLAELVIAPHLMCCFT